MNEQSQNTEANKVLTRMAETIQETLAEFGIKVSVGSISSGPTISRFELHPAKGVRVADMFALSDNIAIALKADCHMFGPVAGKTCLGIDVANDTRTNVHLRDILDSDEWHKASGQLPLALGNDVYNELVCFDLAEIPHLLIGGRSGSGKSVFVDGIVTSLLRRFAPEQVRFAMIDLDVIELQHYNGLPHLFGSIATNPENALLALLSLVAEIGNRHQLLAKASARNITSFNNQLKTSPQTGNALPKELPHIIVIVNEPGELMYASPGQTELALTRITQAGSAVGIHLIISTRDLSVGTTTSRIKANIPARIAFQVTSRADARTLDTPGAEQLMGKGDMLFRAPDTHKLRRIQAPFISHADVLELVNSFRVGKAGASATNVADQ